MSKKIKYRIDRKLKNESFYRKGLAEFTSRETALRLASDKIMGMIEKKRVVEVTERTIKIFKREP